MNNYHLRQLMNGVIPDRLSSELYDKQSHPSKLLVANFPFLVTKSRMESAGTKLVDLHMARQLADTLGDKRILSIQSGRGFLPAALKAVGMKIAAFDAVPPHNNLVAIHQADAVTAIKEWEQESDVLLIPCADGNESALIPGLMHWPDKPIIVIGKKERLIHEPMNETSKIFWGLLDLEEMDIEYPSIRPYMTEKIYIGQRSLMYF